FKPELGRIGRLLLSFEDTEIQQRIAGMGHSVYYTPDATVYHHVPAFRMTEHYFCNRSLGNHISKILMILSENGRASEAHQFINGFRNVPDPCGAGFDESAEEQILEGIYSRFVRDCTEIPLELKVKFVSATAKYYMLLEKYEKAERMCAEGMSLPNISTSQICRLLLRLANIYLKQNKEDQAHEKFCEALCTGSIAGEEAYQMFKAVGEYHHEHGRYAQMQNTVDMIVSSPGVSEENRVMAARYFAAFYSDCGMHEQAEELYKKFFPLDNLENTSKDKLLLGLAELYKNMGRYAEAREVLEKAMELEEIIAAEKSRCQTGLITVSSSDNGGCRPAEHQAIKEPVTSPAQPRFSHLVLDYTRLCNSRCTYCGIWKSRNEPELSLDSIERTFSSLRSFGLSTCYVTGGEPYISDKVVDIARVMHQYLPGSRISGATNGIQPKQIMRRIRKILDIGVPVEVHVSINGGQAAHHATRGGPGFWKKAVFLLETLKSCGVPVKAAMSLMPRTIEDLPYMQKFCADRDIELIYSWVRQYARYGEVDDNYTTWPEQVKPMLRRIEYLPDEFDCVGLSKRLVITPDGSLYPCEVYHPEILLGNVNNESVESILDSPRTASIMKMISAKGCYWCQGAGESEGSPKWMLMDCYRRHSSQAAYYAEHFLQAINMPPEESKQVVAEILSHKSLYQTPRILEPHDFQATPDDNINKNIRISVVVCTHRNPVFLAKTLDSLCRQTLSQDSHEVIVVDNNSNDDTPQVVARYPSVRYIFEERLGLSYARNTGVENSEGDIIAFIDDDAEASSQWLEALLEIYDSTRDVWAAGGKVLPIWDSEKPAWLTQEYNRSLSLVEWGENARALCWPERIIGTNCSFRRRVFDDIGLFDTCLGRIGTALLGNEDTEIQQRIHALGHLVYYSPQAVVYHHVTASRMTKDYFTRREQGTKISRAILGLRSQGNNRQAEQLAEEVRQSVGGLNACEQKLESPARKPPVGEDCVSAAYSENPSEMKWPCAETDAEIVNEVSRHVSQHESESARAERIDLLYDRVRDNSRRLLMDNKDRYRGQRCVIIGNGPSLNNTDLSLLKNEYTFGLNKIYLLFDRIDWRPSFYVSVNPFVIEQSAEQILNEIHGLKFLDFAAFKYLPYMEDTAYLLSLNGKGFSTDPCTGVFQIHTVTCVAMQLAYHMGFDEVFLIGVDHFFNAAKQGRPDQVVLQAGCDADHFDPNYFAGGQQWNLPNLKGSEEGYRLAKETFERAGRKIYDATVAGRLTVFEKVDYLSVFGNKSNSSLRTCVVGG
ncbi:MAG: glycosyltransferase, partial [Planctomycetota bacterium]